MAPPRIIDRYALFDAIARGGMAAVHLGRLVGSAGFARTVAIKRLHPQFAQEAEFVEMFVDEARVAARIQHPNVVPTLDVVHTADELFIVMDYVQGESLARLFKTLSRRGQAMPPQHALPIVAGALHGLHAAHTATDEHGDPLNIVHRDVSPQNIIVGVDGTPRVFDFGVAKARGRLHNTQTGQVKGKISYMAPEQLRGEEVGPYTDVFSIGVVLWELLAGRRFYEASYEAEVIGMIMRGLPDTPPSAHQPDVSPELDAIVMCALHSTISQRYQSAREMARDLEALGGFTLAAELGEWVEELAGETMVTRGRLVAEIESDSGIIAEISTDGSDSLVSSGRYGAKTSDRGREEESGTKITHVAAPRRTAESAWRAVALVAVGASVAMVALMLLMPRRTEEGAVEEGAAAAEAAAPTATMRGSQDGRLTAQSAMSTATPVPSATAEGSSLPPPVVASPPTLPRRAKRRPFPAPSKPPPAQPKSGGCTPPYYFDKDGIKHFKPQCL
ncbi:MAG: serine/threonine-protein kinase [Myxococcota bacterium]